MAETINYAAMHNGVVLVGHRSANGAAYTSVGRSPTTRAISTSFSTIRGLKARTITATFSRPRRVRVPPLGGDETSIHRAVIPLNVER